MPYGDNKHFEHLKLPVTWTVMGIVGFICVVAAVFLLGDRSERMEQPRGGVGAVFDTVAEPVGGVIAAPARVVGDGTNIIDEYLFAVKENRALKKKVEELQQYHDLYIQQKDINERYEALLNLRTEPPVQMITARSVTVSRGPFNNNRLIDAGTEKGIGFGNPVITEHGLIGRVAGSSAGVSRVLMVTDVVSHVPVMVMRTDARAMMNGDGGSYPKLDFVRGRDVIKEGDQILTSGDGGIFPRGLPVGIARKGADGWRVQLYANRGPIDFVKILLYKDFSNLPDADQLRTPSVTTVLPTPTAPTSGSASSSTTGSASGSAASSSVSAPSAAASRSATSASRTSASRSQTASPPAASAQP